MRSPTKTRLVPWTRNSCAQPCQFSRSGKTTLLERTIKDLKEEFKLFVVEGDQATARDGERIRAAGAAAVQSHRLGCHSKPTWWPALQHLKPGAGSIVMIENVGNLVCPALFDLGERRKVVIFSVTEGEDKPLNIRPCSAPQRL